MAKRRARRSSPALSPLFDGDPAEVRRINQSVMRGEWVDPTDVTPGATRSPRRIAGWRSFDPLRRCYASPSSRITLEHISAADRLRQLADGVMIGFSGGRDYAVVQSWAYGPSTGPGRPAIRSAKCWPALRRAMALFDAGERELVTAVVLLNQNVRQWCLGQRELGQAGNPAIEMTRLVDCLDRLVEHFQDDIQRHGLAA